MDRPKHTELGQVFNFTLQDLDANRKGRLSPTQSARLRGEATRTLYVVWGVLVTLGILTFISIQVTGGELFMMLACLSVPAAVAFAFTLGTTGAAIAPMMVSKRTGQIHISRLPTGFDPPLTDEQETRYRLRSDRFRAGVYILIVDDLVFRLTMDEHKALVPSIYTVYFLPTLNKIVSLELVVAPDGSDVYVDRERSGDLDAVPAALPDGRAVETNGEELRA